MAGANIIDGAGTNQLTIDATSKAARVTLYDAAGTAVVSPLTSGGGFLAYVLLRASAATGANSIQWSLFNTSSTIVARIRAMRFGMLFDGTSPGAQGRNYAVYRTYGSAFAAPTGGTAITPTKKRTADSASALDCRFLDTGLIVGSVASVGDPFIRMNLTMSATGSIQAFEYPSQMPLGQSTEFLELRQWEGIGIYNLDVAVIGEGLCGYVEWDEQAV